MTAPSGEHTARAAEETPGRSPTRLGRRAWPGMALRAAAVLAVAGVIYSQVVPTTHIVRSRLAQLMVDHSGTATFPGLAASAGERPATTGSLGSLQAAAKASPSRTGLFVASWRAKSTPNDGLALVAFLLPDAATATRVRSELQGSQLSAKAYQAASLSRTGQWTPAGVPGATGSLYSSAANAKSKGKVAVSVWQTGRTVGLVEAVATTGSPQAVATASAQSEAAHLRAVEPGFTLAVTRYPTTASALWIAGAVVLAALAGAVPPVLRRRRQRRATELQERLDRTIQVRGQTIVRHRRGS